MTFEFKATTDTITKVTALLSKFPSEEKVLEKIDKKEKILIECFKLLSSIKNNTKSEDAVEDVKVKIRTYLKIIEAEKNNLKIFKKDILPHIFRLLKYKSNEEFKQKFEELKVQTDEVCNKLIEFIDVNIDKKQEILLELANNKDLNNVFEKFKEHLKHQKRVMAEINLKEEINELLGFLKKVRRPNNISGSKKLSDIKEIALALSVAASILLIMASLMMHPTLILASFAPIGGIFYTLKSYFNPDNAEKTLRSALKLVSTTREIDKRIL